MKKTSLYLTVITSTAGLIAASAARASTSYSNPGSTPLSPILTPADWSTGWSRGSADTTYQEWDDSFVATNGASPPIAASYNPNGTANTVDLTAASDGAFIIPKQFDGSGDIYSFEGDVDPSTPNMQFQTTAPDYNLGSGYLTTVVVQIATSGNELDYGSITVDGQSAVAEAIERTNGGMMDGGQVTNAQVWAEFQVPTSGSLLTLDYNAEGPSVALEGVAIDSITTPVVDGYYPVTAPTFVPEPMSASLLGVLPIGLLMRRRRQCVR